MKPRIAESGPALWAAVKELNISGVVPPGGGVYYPAIRIVCGGTFVLDVNHKPQAITGFGISTRNPRQSEIEELEDAVEKDQVEALKQARAERRESEGRYGVPATFRAMLIK